MVCTNRRARQRVLQAATALRERRGRTMGEVEALNNKNLYAFINLSIELDFISSLFKSYALHGAGPFFSFHLYFIVFPFLFLFFFIFIFILDIKKRITR